MKQFIVLNSRILPYYRQNLGTPTLPSLLTSFVNVPLLLLLTTYTWQAFTQPWDHLLAKPCTLSTNSVLGTAKFVIFRSRIHRGCIEKRQCNGIIYLSRPAVEVVSDVVDAALQLRDALHDRLEFRPAQPKRDRDALQVCCSSPFWVRYSEDFAYRVRPRPQKTNPKLEASIS